MDERRDIAVDLVRRVLLASPLAAAGWFLFAKSGGSADKQLLGLACFVACAYILAPVIASLLAEPAGSLFFPQRRAAPQPAYSTAEAKRRRGEYEEALAQLDQIAADFPAEVRTYIMMMEIAFVNLQDGPRTDAIAKRGLAALKDDSSRSHLLWIHRELKSRVPEEPWVPEPEAAVEAEPPDAGSAEPES